MPEMLFYDGIAADGQRVWLIITKYNVLMEIDRDTGEISWCKFLGKYRISSIPYRFLLKHEENLILLPYEANDICIYDIKQESFKHIDLDVAKLKENTAWQFTGYEKIGNNLVAYGLCSLILIMDLTTFEIIYLDLKDKLPESLKIRYWFWRYSYLINNKLFLIPQSCSCVIELDIYSRDVKYRKLPDRSGDVIDNPVLDGSTLYYFNNEIGENVALAMYDLETEKFTTYDLGIKQIGINKTFTYAACANGVLWMLPGACKDGYKYDIAEKKLEILNGLPTVSANKLSNFFPYEFNYRNGILNGDGHILAVHAWSCQLIDIDTAKESVKRIPILKNNQAEWEKLFEEFFSNFFSDFSDEIYTEFVDGMLEFYIDKAVMAGQGKKDGFRSAIGKDIYQSISNLS